MCLQTNWEQAKIAKTDIIVYKILSCVSKKYLTPYRNARVEIGKTYESDLDEPQLKFYIGNSFERIVKVSLHSFANKKSIIAAQTKESGITWFGKRVLVKCVIPKGSEYVKGKFSSLTADHNSYTSNQLQYLEIIGDYHNES